MIYRQFTSRELFCMAQLCRKTAMYGIPDGFEMLPEEEIPQAKAAVLDDLLTKGITSMDMDGRTGLADASYQALITAICDCEACLTVSYQSGQERSEDVVFWKTAAGYLRADVEDDRFVFVSEDAAGIRAYLATVTMRNRAAAEDRRSVTVPQVALSKAKRAVADGQEEDARRALRQNGADPFTETILTGLQEKADYLGLLFLENTPDDNPPEKAAFLCANGVLLTLSETVLNYRDCTVFSACSESEAAARIKAFWDRFLPPVEEPAL